MASRNSSNSARRRALLAKIHIAAKECGLDDATYREILMDEFGVRSAGTLSVQKLETLVKRFESKGWRPKGKDSSKLKAQSSKENSQAEALKERVGQLVLHTEFDEKRLRGLVRKICGVDDLRFCRETVRLKRLVAVLGDILEKEACGETRRSWHKS